MRKNGLVAAAAALLAGTGGPWPAVASVPPAKRPAPRPGVTGVKGTAQLPGDVGQVGATYTLTGYGRQPVNLTVTDFAYVGSRLDLAGKTVVPRSAADKFLVIDFTAQNPNPKSTLSVESGFVKFVAVDALGQDRVWEGLLENTESRLPLHSQLLPGQKVAARGYIEVPAEGEVPKLVLDWGARDNKVLRFDLHGVVKPVEEVLRDPADPSGATARAVIPDAKVGVTYPTAWFDVTVDKFELVPGPLGDRRKPGPGKVFLVTTLRAHNVAREDREFTCGGALRAEAADADGDRYEWVGTLYKASTDASAEVHVAPGAEKTYRVLTPVPQGAPLKTLSFSLRNDQRKLVYDLSGVK